MSSRRRNLESTRREPPQTPASSFSFFWFTVVVSIAAALCLFRLGSRALWQDEGETAVLATSVLQHGIPKARIGDNLVLQDTVGFNREYTWTFHPWGQFYLAAASIAALGRSAWAARLPFALCGIATVALLYVFVWRQSKRTSTATVCAILLAISPTFVLHARQCRYYAPDALALLVIVSLLTEALQQEERRRWAWALLGVAFAAQFYVNFATSWIALAALVLWWALCGARRTHLVGVAMAVTIGLILSLPGIMLHHDRLFGGGGGDSPLTTTDKVLAHLAYVDGWFVPFVFLLVGGAATVRRMIRGRPVVRLAWACAVLVILGAAVMAWPAPFPHVRYLIALLPLARLVAGICILGLYDVLLRRSGSRTLALAVAGLVGVLVVTTNVASLPMQAITNVPDQHTPDFCTKSPPYLRSDLAGLSWELTHDFVCPDRIRLATVNELARPGEVVLTNYGDLPLMFFRPDLLLRGGVGGGPRPIEEGRRPDLILIQGRFGTQFRDYLTELLGDGEYMESHLSIPAVMYGNIPEPRAHFFATPMATAEYRVFLRKDHADRAARLPADGKTLLSRWAR